MKLFRLADSNKSSGGFTIIELLIATGIFSVVLLLCATAIVQVGRIFYKGTIVNKTQATSRRVVDDISEAIQFGGGSNDPSFSIASSATYGSVSVQSRCIGDIRYSYFLRGKSLGTNVSDQLLHILWKDRLGSGNACTPLDISKNDPGGMGGQELLGTGMRLTAFTITTPVPPNNSWQVDIGVSYGAADDVYSKNGDGTTNYDQCTANKAGGQFCATSPITTYVTRRL